MDFVFCLKIRKDNMKDGLGIVYYYCRIGKEQKKINANIKYAPSLLDESTSRLLPRKKEDIECQDYNLIIGKHIGDANRIARESRLFGKKLSMHDFLRQFNNSDNTKRFDIFFEGKIKERFRRGKITDGTKKSHINALIWLRQFKSQVIYQELDKKFIEKLETWLKKQVNHRANDKKKLAENTIAGILKSINAYINLAIKDDVAIENPFKKADVKLVQDECEIEFLMPGEVAKLMRYYTNIDMPVGEKLSLCRFLIACVLSLRISDILRINNEKIEHYKTTKKLSFYPKKQQKSKPKKVVHISIDDTALVYLNDLMRIKQECTNKNYNISEAYGRKALIRIGQKVGIKLGGFHKGRHTFATNYLRAGGKIHNLQQIMGHANIKTTMKYIHVVEQDKDEEMVQLNSFYQKFL